MARFDTSGLDELLREMERMGETSGEIAEAMVAAAAEEIRDAWKETAEEYDLRDTGAMIESVGFPKKVQRIGDVVYQEVYPQGVDAKGVRNAEKAFVLHYGTSRIKPTHWVDDAEERAEPRVEERLTGIWDEYIETGKIPTVTVDSGATDGSLARSEEGAKRMKRKNRRGGVKARREARYEKAVGTQAAQALMRAHEAGRTIRYVSLNKWNSYDWETKLTLLENGVRPKGGKKNIK